MSLMAIILLFLQPMNVDSGKHIGIEFDIHLFTNISLQAESD